MQSHTLAMNVFGALGRFAPRYNVAKDQVSTQSAPPRRRGLLDRLDQWQRTQRQRALERYLAKATDLCDLEARLRALDRPVGYRC
jgi:hypothetical protein